MSAPESMSPEAAALLRDLAQKRRAATDVALRVADEQIAGVRARGDAFVAEQIARFDGVILAPHEIAVGAPASSRPFRRLPAGTAVENAIDLAIARIEAFHLPQLPASYRRGSLVHRVRPLRRAGIYVPGGRAVYVSTLIMCAVPARIAGVRELVVATTPTAAATRELQYACHRLGITTIYRAGGAAGIAAMALGTASLERVDKIVGPGNAYVTAAKARLVGEVGIDMTAGPTELVVIADETADADLVIADLLAQAEHGEDSAVILLTTSAELTKACGGSNVQVLTVPSIDDAVALANRIAPEHLSIQTRDAESVAERADNCGAIFCGPFSPVAAGDYIAGPNHVLPTAGSARFFSPLGVYDFVKRSNVIALTKEEIEDIAEPAARLATFEGLPRHAESLERRLPAGRSAGFQPAGAPR